MTNPGKTVQVAAAKGKVAGIAAAQSLRGEQGSPSTPCPAPDADGELAEVPSATGVAR